MRTPARWPSVLSATLLTGLVMAGCTAAGSPDVTGAPTPPVEAVAAGAEREASAGAGDADSVLAAATPKAPEGPADTTTRVVPVPRFEATVGPVPAEVAERSTWRPGCPVALDELAYVTVTVWGFDGGTQQGEMIVHQDVADDVVAVFEALFDARFPIEELRVTSPADLEREPTGDENTSESFVCRPVTGGSGWSQHAYGLAIDLNPFQNPYVRGDVVIPALAGEFLDRDLGLPGMINDGDVVVRAFEAIGWGWGGDWSSLSDWQHFSRSGT